jgi:hypothetical protein
MDPLQLFLPAQVPRPVSEWLLQSADPTEFRHVYMTKSRCSRFGFVSTRCLYTRTSTLDAQEKIEHIQMDGSGNQPELTYNMAKLTISFSVRRRSLAIRFGEGDFCFQKRCDFWPKDVEVLVVSITAQTASSKTTATLANIPSIALITTGTEASQSMGKVSTMARLGILHGPALKMESALRKLAAS